MKKNSGFSLLELMLTLAIIGILTSLAYPLYTQHITQVHRKQAQISLYNLANRMEGYYFENNHSYANATVDQLGFDTTELLTFYKIDISATDTTYILHATPIGNQAKQDIHCGTLSLNQLGEKKSSGDNNTCW